MYLKGRDKLKVEMSDICFYCSVDKETCVRIQEAKRDAKGNHFFISLCKYLKHVDLTK